MERFLPVMILAVLTTTAAGDGHHDPRCACKYTKEGLPERFWKGGKYENLAAVSQYGASCAPWDSIPGTPWHEGSCDTTKGKDYCTRADSWCDDAWCYVDKSCPFWKATDVFADVLAAKEELGYSYQTCGSTECYTTKDDPAQFEARGCPNDPQGLCDDPCKCLYANGGLPEEAWKDGPHKDLKMISQYGATCAPWDSIPDTPWYGSCDTSKTDENINYCHREHSWCAASWCYVSDKCPTYTKTSVFKDTPGWENLGYSYQKCGAPNCYTDKNIDGCPYDWSGQCCQCKYQTGLPSSYWQGSQYASLSMIASYGVQCAPWDSLPGTPYFDGYCDISKGVDYCDKDDQWCNDPWCYVDKDTCGSWVASSVFKDVEAAPKTLGYSYNLCGSPNCYTKTEAACPYDPHHDCAGVGTTCGAMKSAYKGEQCCGNPTKKLRFK